MLDDRLTEQRNPRSSAMDALSSLELVDLINSEDQAVAEAVGSQRLVIARAIDLVVDAFRSGGRLIYVGAGTSCHSSANQKNAARSTSLLASRWVSLASSERAVSH